MANTPQSFMQAAIDAGSSVDLSKDVNPRVGAILVDGSGQIITTGIHHGSGTLHAEVDAITKAKEKLGVLNDLTLYTTLEPCNSTGKQGPCSRAIVEAGIKKVVIGQLDPNPKMSGGIEFLKQNGIEVTSGLLADSCIDLNPSWTFAHKTGMPWVIWKIATSLDGFIASVDGTSKWITGNEARSDVQKLRASVGAIITGTGTVLADDPELTVREISVSKQPLRVVVGSRKIPADAKLNSGQVPAIHLKGDIKEVLKNLFEEFGVHKVLVEAGPGLSKSLWQQKLINEVYWYQAMLVLGSGVGAIGDFGVTTLTDGLRFTKTEVNRVGLDVLIHFNTD